MIITTLQNILYYCLFKYFGMHKNSLIVGIGLFFSSVFTLSAQEIVPAAHRVQEYIPLLQNKSIGVVANHTSLIEDTHIVDSLLNMNVDIKYIFSPEHGFRGNEDAGKLILNSTDSITGLPVISLYGKQKKPAGNYFEHIDFMLFDLQDVGFRFYTYISTLHYVMEACAENDTPLILLDRPNPNGYYIDGPVLDTAYRSFVGLHPIPVVYGLTIGELAFMINGEGWINEKCDLKVIECDEYTHRDLYDLPVPPSPNLPNMQAVYLYPSLAFFEGTVMSVGRGTRFPFQVYGHPKYNEKDFYFVPLPTKGASNPKYNGQKCYGHNLNDLIQLGRGTHGIKPEYLKDAYLKTQTDKFFNSFFKLLAGTTKLQQQIEDGESAEQIKSSWHRGLNDFNELRKKYLLYEDFDRQGLKNE